MIQTFSGNRGLQLEEPLIFELDLPNISGVDIDPVEVCTQPYLAGKTRSSIGLPGLSEPRAIRHYTRLSQKNYSIDAGMYPLGSCTMKHNPRINEKVARYFSDLHPLQPHSTVQGAYAIIHELAFWLMELTGMSAVVMSPAAGAHGELCGIMAIKKALEVRSDTRNVILVPESAHGTNPATAAACGFEVKTIPANEGGRVDIKALLEAIDSSVAGIMLTNPNTCGLFEVDIIQIADAIHAIDGYFYCDGANFNAIVGKVKPADLGVDCMHINLHKTFSTPHGGGGPGSGPVVLSDRLAPYAPLPYVVKKGGEYCLIEDDTSGLSLGRIKGFHGQMGMFTRALAFIISHGKDGLRQISEDAVMNANYILACLKKEFSPAFSGFCMHEVLFSDSFLKDTEVTTLDFAKAMIDEGYHPMTMYFPLVVHGAMLIEPTESETKQSLDDFCDMMLDLVKRAKSGDAQSFKESPRLTPRRRLDETLAARSPKLRWEKSGEITSGSQVA